MNEIPLSLYIAMCGAALGLIIFSLVYNENFVRIITSLVAMVLSYVNAQTILNGNVVLIQSTGTSYSYIPVIVPALNYIWLFLAILSFILALLFIADEININMQDALDEKEAEANKEFT
jgi:hypothetical protein